MAPWIDPKEIAGRRAAQVRIGTRSVQRNGAFGYFVGQDFKCDDAGLSIVREGPPELVARDEEGENRFESR